MVKCGCVGVMEVKGMKWIAWMRRPKSRCFRLCRYCFSIVPTKKCREKTWKEGGLLNCADGGKVMAEHVPIPDRRSSEREVELLPVSTWGYP